MIKKLLPFLPFSTLIIIIVVGGLALIGLAKSYINGPDLALTTIFRPKIVPVKVETVKWMTKIKREKVTIPVEVIREVPAKEAKKLSDGFHINLTDLHSENKELVDVLSVPKAPRGGEMALTANISTGKIEGIFKATPSPIFEIGGMKEIGVDYNVLGSSVGIYYRQDVLRAGPIVFNGKLFVDAPLTVGKTPRYGASIGGAFRF